jgi:hypothetical protein
VIPAQQPRSLFESFFMAGFECSSHRRADGERLDLICATDHDKNAREDFRACVDRGLLTIRDGLRWHLIEDESGQRDWDSWLPVLDAAQDSGAQVVWDLLHYGLPDHLPLRHPRFVDRFASYAADAAKIHREVTGTPALVCPINEISYFTWAVNTGYFPGLAEAPRGWVKERLVTAALAACRAMKNADPEIRFVWAEPLINIFPASTLVDDLARAEALHLGQFEAYDMLLGRSRPELGGGPWAVDALGFNYYPDNQWVDGGSTIPLGHHHYRPLSNLLAEAYERFGKPIFLSETGAEGSARSSWLHYVCDEVREAQSLGVPVLGICLYPVASFPGWDDLRMAEVGLLGPAASDGSRSRHAGLRRELERQQRIHSEPPETLHAQSLRID